MEMWLTIGKVGPTNSSNSLKLRGVSRCVHPEALLDCETDVLCHVCPPDQHW